MWWKKWTNNRDWEKRKKSCERSGDSWAGTGATNTATCRPQINRPPVFLPLLLDSLFSVEENKSPRRDSSNRGKGKSWPPDRICTANYFVLVLLCVVFPRRWPKQSNQIVFPRDAAPRSHGEHTMDKFISLRQQGCQYNLWVCWSESRLRAGQLGMLMGFGWGSESVFDLGWKTITLLSADNLSWANETFKANNTLKSHRLLLLLSSLHFPEPLEVKTWVAQWHHLSFCVTVDDAQVS